jgi:hypothetical protein
MRLGREDRDDVADGVGGLRQGRALGVVEIDLEDLLDAGTPM